MVKVLCPYNSPFTHTPLLRARGRLGNPFFRTPYNKTLLSLDGSHTPLRWAPWIGGVREIFALGIQMTKHPILLWWSHATGLGAWEWGVRETLASGTPYNK